jgi:2-polyprenyl-3-methyl-5-hydroxy-6-metoxy-1,4-benzoquinol methylase
MNRDEVKDFFEKNAQSWVLNGYNDDGYNYPTALSRLNILTKILATKGTSLKIADLGCGGGQVSLALAELGHQVTGIDESKNMIELSTKLKSTGSKEVQERVQFKNASILENGEEASKYDVCIAMGVIGYFAKDEDLFNEVKRLLKPGGLFLVSCRNQLFNMQSISFRTINEIKNGNAQNLVEEILSLYNPVPPTSCDAFIKNLKDVAKDLPDHSSFKDQEMKAPAEKLKGDKDYKPFYEPRQHTPTKISTTAKNCGFSTKSFHGVHPHLIDPNLNKLLPPKIFNQLSSCLEAMNDLPVALVYSSVFIGTFCKEL